MQPGLAATLVCLQVAQTVQTLSAAVLLSCTLPVVADDSCEADAVPGTAAAATAAAAAAAAAPVPCCPAAGSPSATPRKRPRQQRAQQGPQRLEQQQDSGAACQSQQTDAEEQPGSSTAKQARRQAKEERRRLRQARRAAKEEARRQRKNPQQAEHDRREQQLRPQQNELLHAEQEADGHPGQPTDGVIPQAAAAAAEPQAAAAHRAADPDRAVGAATTAAAGQTPQQQGGPDLYRFWAPNEVERLLRCVDEPQFRRELLGSEELDWHAIAAHFERSVQAVRSKYRHEQVTKADKESGQGHRGGSMRKAISYGYMALFGLASLPERSGTGEEVCAAVEAHGPFQPLLDRSCRPDSAGVLKWKQRIREELSHRSYFVNTGQKRGGEAIWQLDASNFDSMPAAQRKRLAAQQLPGLPLLGKHGLLNG